MDNYGESIYDKNNNLIGYKTNNDEFVTISTYYNENNLLCNKVSVKDFDESSLSFNGNYLISWIDTKIENGFVREYNKNKYYYDKDNNLINFETIKKCLPFPLSKKDTTLN